MYCYPSFTGAGNPLSVDRKHIISNLCRVSRGYMDIVFQQEVAGV